jgi:hypothetical protein
MGILRVFTLGIVPAASFIAVIAPVSEGIALASALPLKSETVPFSY